jgi:hypothetical protein
MTVMFRRKAVLLAGNYQPMQGFEDYYLWVRMVMSGSHLANLDDILVYARCGGGGSRSDSLLCSLVDLPEDELVFWFGDHCLVGQA